MLPSKNQSSLIDSLQRDFPQVSWLKGDNLQWSSKNKAITYTLLPGEANNALLLHELAHALLNHDTFKTDIELLRQESSAWDYAIRNLASRYAVIISDELVQNCLDTYRDWLHKRSRCPSCRHIGVQYQKNAYNCLNCRHSWGVNDARQCGLRRFRLPAQGQTEL